MCISIHVELRQAPSCTSLIDVPLCGNQELESQEVMSCPSDLETSSQATQSVCHYSSQESLHEAHTKSLVVAHSFAYEPSKSFCNHSASLNLPRVVPISSSSSHTRSTTQQPGVPILQPPPFLLKKPASLTSGPQVQCSQGESIRPPTSDVISTLQNKLRLVADTTTKVNSADQFNTAHSPAAKHTNPCPRSPLNRIKSECISRQHSHTSQSSAGTLKAHSSSRSSSPSSECYVSPMSSPLLTPRAGEGVHSKPVLCTEESSINEHSLASQNHQYVKDTSCLLYTSPSPRDATLSRMPSSA